MSKEIICRDCGHAMTDRDLSRRGALIGRHAEYGCLEAMQAERKKLRERICELEQQAQRADGPPQAAGEGER